MTAKEVLEYVIRFIENDFAHLRDKVDLQYKITIRFFISLIIGLLGVIGGLLYLIVGK